MTTVAILPVTSVEGIISYQAIAGLRIAAGNTVGEALDALGAKFPEMNSEPLVVVQRFRPDPFFAGDQQRRLEDLMNRWREARDRGELFSSADEAELASLVNLELVASAKRAAEASQGLGR